LGLRGRELQEIHDFYFSTKIIHIIKSRRMRWLGHLVLMRKKRMHTGYRRVNLKEGEHLEYLGIDGTIILKLLLKKYCDGVWSGLVWLRMGISFGLL